MNENVKYLQEAYGVSEQFAIEFEQMRKQWIEDTDCDIDLIAFMHECESEAAEYLFETMSLDSQYEYQKMQEKFYESMTPVQK